MCVCVFDINAKLFTNLAAPLYPPSAKNEKNGNNNPICKTEKETQMYRTDFWTLWEKARVGCFERTALKHVYYLG